MMLRPIDLRLTRLPRPTGTDWLLVLLLVLAPLACADAGDEGRSDGDAVPPSAEPLPAHPGPESDAAAEDAPEDGRDGAVASGREGAGRTVEGGNPAAADGGAADGPPALRDPVSIPADPPTFERPEHVRGLYLNAWTSGSSRRVAALLDLARRTEINTFVIDIKDASGYVSHSTGVPLAREVGATRQLRIGDLEGLLRRLSAEGVYPVARIVVVKDPILVAARPDLGVQDTAGGVWVDGKDIRWLNPYHREVWEYHVDLAREVARMGFPEIQWDYVRFPDAPASELARARFPGSDGVSKADAIRAFLEYSREELSDLDVDVTADVFGVTTSAVDVGIGQVWESFIDVVDVALPMVYPSHYWKGSFGIAQPNAYPYEIVKRALEDGLARSRRVEGAGATRPWLQAFSLGEPRYQAPEIRAQMQAAYDVGIQEWVLWNPSSRYLEEALEPEGGFPTDPLIRVAGQVVPVSRRHEVLRAAAEERDSTRAVPPVEVRDTVRRDTTAGGTGLPAIDLPLLDSVRPIRPTPGRARPDTTAADTTRPDTTVARDAGRTARR